MKNRKYKELLALAGITLVYQGAYATNQTSSEPDNNFTLERVQIIDKDLLIISGNGPCTPEPTKPEEPKNQTEIDS